MRTCEICHTEHQREEQRTCGENACLSKLLKRAKRNRARREREQIMRDLGLIRVRGNLGGTYWE